MRARARHHGSIFRAVRDRLQFPKSPTLEFVAYLRAAYGEQPFSFTGDNHRTDSARLAVLPIQRPHPPLWMMSRDPQTLEFCAANAINPGYFISFPRTEAAPGNRKFVEDWRRVGHERPPNIAYSTIVYADETDEKALEVARFRASRAYEGLLPSPQHPEETFESRVARRGAASPAPPRSCRTCSIPITSWDRDLVFIGSPETVAGKLRKAAETGMFNTFMGEFNFADLPEQNLMNSIRLFGTRVIPRLRDFEPF